jgi:hypothetical protein
MIPKRWVALPEELSAHFDPLAWSFVSTQELPELCHVIDQKRAVRAVE